MFAVFKKINHQLAIALTVVLLLVVVILAIYSSSFEEQEKIESENASSTISNLSSRDMEGFDKVLIAPGHRSARYRKVVSGNRLNAILGDTGLSVLQRVETLESLKSSLNRNEQEQIYRAIENRIIPEGITGPSWHWIVDELISSLRGMGADPTEITTRLVALYLDRKQHEVVRDYALQHLGHLRSEGGDIELIEQALVGAISEKEGSIAGTALLALNQKGLLADTAETAIKVAEDVNASLHSRVTAIQVAGKQGDVKVLPLAIEITENRLAPVLLRMAAIATLADLGATDQLPLIKDLSLSMDTRLSAAASAALIRLSNTTH